jgi:uncharacterized membrane protein YgcG
MKKSILSSTMNRNLGLFHKVAQTILLNLFLMSLFFLVGCGTIDLKSRWRDREITIDGKNTEWRYLNVLDDKETSVGVSNDNDFLYLILITTNRGVHNQVARRGLTLWFDSDGGKDEKFGIHYPIGFGGIRSAQDSRPESDNEGQNLRKENSTDELEIIGPKKEDRHRMTLAETGGIEARFTTSNDVLVYEMKVPLLENSTHPFAIGTKSGARIGVGAVTLADRVPERPVEGFGESGGERGEGAGERSGSGTGGRGGGGRRSGGGRKGSSSQAEPFTMWAKVQLASNDTVMH